MKPGFFSNETPLVASTNITNTTYSFSSAYNTGTTNQLFAFVTGTLAGGATSFEWKIQQSLSLSGGTWFDTPIIDAAGIITAPANVNEEYVAVARAYTIRYLLAQNGNNLGPFGFSVSMPFFRLAYKITGAGTGNFNVILSRCIV
jgi:hypothetical protein